MASRPARVGVLVVGANLPAADVLANAVLRYDEVIVVARAVHGPDDRYVIDEDRAYENARRRGDAVARALRACGVPARVAVGDESATAARRDAEALYPGAVSLA
jgi:hypothetical protein